MDTPLPVLHADYETTSVSLQNTLVELAEANCRVFETRIAAWFNTDADTAKARDLQADYATQLQRRDVFIMQAHVDALRERLSLIDHIIAFRS